MVQGLRLHPSTAGGMGNIRGWGTKILHAMWHSQNVKKKRERETERKLQKQHSDKEAANDLMVKETKQEAKNKCDMVTKHNSV